MNNTPAYVTVDKTTNHLANERTFLAWIRTSISIIVFGFVVARFGIALREFFLMQSHLQVESTKQSNVSLSIGVGFMIVGTLIALSALIRYHITMRRIENCAYRPASITTVIVGLFTALFGATLIAYLIFTAQSLL